MRTLNKNENRRLEILKPFLQANFTGPYDIAHFQGLDCDTLLTLISEGFVDIEECQNDSPSIRHFFMYSGAHGKRPLFHGYIVSPNRSDYRISIEGLEQEENTQEEMNDFREFCKHADELEIGPEYMRSWWD